MAWNPAHTAANRFAANFLAKRSLAWEAFCDEAMSSERLSSLLRIVPLEPAPPHQGAVWLQLPTSPQLCPPAHQSVSLLPRENRASAQHKTLEARNTLNMWKKAYFDTRAKIEASGREARWEFDRKRLFERTDYMATICQDLYDILQVGRLGLQCTQKRSDLGFAPWNAVWLFDDVDLSVSVGSREVRRVWPGEMPAEQTECSRMSQSTPDLCSFPFSFVTFPRPSPHFFFFLMPTVLSLQDLIFPTRD